MDVIKCVNLNKSFGNRKVINELNLLIKENEFVIIMGPSGCGKTSLLNMLGLLDKPTSGELYLFNEKVDIHSKKALMMLRDKISFVFQNYGLIDDETVYQNLEYALSYVKVKDKKEKIRSALKIVGMDDFINEKVFTLSGGQQQRIALARALLKPSELILADEPTGNLDDENRQVVVDILVKFKEQGKTVIVVTHDKRFEEIATKTVNL